MENTPDSTPVTTNPMPDFLEILTPGPGIDFNDVRGAIAVALIETGIVTPDTTCETLNGNKVKVTGKIATGYPQLKEGLERVKKAIGEMCFKRPPTPVSNGNNYGKVLFDSTDIDNSERNMSDYALYCEKRANDTP